MEEESASKKGGRLHCSRCREAKEKGNGLLQHLRHGEGGPGSQVESSQARKKVKKKASTNVRREKVLGRTVHALHIMRTSQKKGGKDVPSLVLRNEGSQH